MSDPTLRDELLMLDAQIRQFLNTKTRDSWADRRDYFFRVAQQLRELAATLPDEPAAETDRRAA